MKKIITAITLLIFLLLSCSQDYMVMNNNDDNLVQEKTNSGSITVTVNTSSKREIAGLSDDKLNKTNLIDSLLRFLRVIPKSDINSVTVKVDGYGIPTTIESNIVIANGTGTGTISNIPIGKNRIISVIAKDGSTNLIPGAVLRTSIDIIAGTNTASIKWDTTPRGNIYYNLLQSDIANSTTYSRDVTSDALEAFIQSVIVDNSITHQSLVNAEKIASDIVANSGTLPVSTAGYKIATGSVKFTISDYTSGTVSAFATDPSSQIVSITANGVFTIANVYPGSDWRLLFTVDGSSGNIYTIGDVTSDVTTDIGEISLSTKVTLVDLPTATTYSTTLDITVSGTNIVSYKYSLDGGAWSAETPIATHITASSLSLGAHSIGVYGKDSFGNWQSVANATTHNWTIEETPLYLRLSKFAEPYTEYPCIVNLLFGIKDQSGNPVAGIYDNTRYILKANNVVPDGVENQFRIRERNVFNVTLKTILVVDLSNSIGTNLTKLKDAVKYIINNKYDNQYIEIWVFASIPTKLIDFTLDKNALLAATDSMTLKGNSTNLFGSIYTALDDFENSFSLNNVTNTFMVVLADGNNSDLNYTEDQVVAKRGNKSILTVGIGTEIDASGDETLSRIGETMKYIKSPTFDDLMTQITDAMDYIIATYQNICWLTYYTDLNAPFDLPIELSIKDNTNISSDSKISGYFNTNNPKFWYDLQPTIYVNDYYDKPDGDSSITFADNETSKTFYVNSYYGKQEPVWSIEISDPDAYTLTEVTNDEKETYKVTRVNGGNVILTIRDTANDFIKNISIQGSEMLNLTFNSQGGSFVPSQFNTQSFYAVEPVAPTRDGYTFEGWYMDTGYLIEWDFITYLVDSNTVVFAKWNPITYTITYNLNDGINNVNNPSTYNPDLSVIILQAPTRVGYTFSGWYDNIIFLGSSITEIPQGSYGDKEFYVRWLLNYTITYNLNGGLNDSNNPQTFTIETDTIDLLNPSKTGYTFGGWYDNSELTGMPITQIVKGTNVNKSFWSKWNVNQYAITFDKQDGTGGTNSITVTYDSQMPEATAPTKANGYTFLGYWDSITGGIQYYSSSMSSTRNWDKTANTTLYARWTNEYAISFNKQSGTGGTDNITAIYGTAMPAAMAPSRTGYTFTGYWDATSDGTQYYSSSAMLSVCNWDKTANTTLYARWSVNGYTVTFDKQNGTGGTDIIEVTFGLLLPEATAPIKTGYTFNGYWDATSGGNQYYNSTMTSMRNWDKATDTTLYARWVANTYTITFDKQGGSGGTISATATYAAPLPIATSPSRTGYTFNGYWDATTDGIQYYSSTMSKLRSWDKTTNTTLYARWIAKIYTVTFNKQSGTGGTDTATAIYGSAMPTATAPTRTGYTFNGYWDSTSGGNQYYDSAMTSIINWNKTTNTTLYARWIANTYNITFDKQEGTGGTDTATAIYGSAMPIATAPIRDGYSFIGYWDATNDGIQYYSSSMTSIRNWDKTANTIIYARWAIITVTFNKNGGSGGTDTVIATCGMPMPYASAPTRTGYTFDGYWYSSTQYYNSSMESITNWNRTTNTTLSAKWIANTYNITFDKQIGTGGTDNIIATFGSIMPESVAPSRIPYTFLGYWNTTIGGVKYYNSDMSSARTWDRTEDTTLYARWNNLDYSFDPGTGLKFIEAIETPQTHSLAIQSDGKIIIGGKFDIYNEASRKNIARLNIDGSLDTLFDPGTGTNGIVFTTAIQNDGKIIIGGEFTTYNGVTRNRILRLNNNGSRDTTFSIGTGADYTIYCISIQNDGKIIIGGNFTSYNGTLRQGLARLNTNGSLDTSFDPGIEEYGYVRTISIQTDGKIIIGGNFNSYNGTSRIRLARLNSDGSLDTSFDPGTGANSDTPVSISMQSDGKIIIAGWFTSYNGIPRNRIARLNSDGSLDTTFDPGLGAPYTIKTTAIQSDGKIIIGGWFDSFNGLTIEGLARLNSDGSLDTDFPFPPPGIRVNAVGIQSDGKIILGGAFTSYRIHP